MGDLIPFPRTWDPFLSRRDVARMLGCSISTIKNREREGLPCHKHGGRVMFRWSEVEDYFEQRSA